MRLIPKDKEIGWTPYAWLIYLVLYIIQMIWGEYSLGLRLLQAGGLVVFLALYFRGFWLHGRRLLVIVASLVLLGVLLTPINYGASTFFIYAAGFLGQIPPIRFGVKILLVIMAVVAIETLTIGLAPQAWIPAIVFTALIGAINMHFAEVSRANAGLRLAQGEVKRLAQVAERERIARDLHDLLGHTLSVITLKSELAGRLMERDPERAGVEIREVEEISRRALTQVRRAVEGYREASLGAELANAKLVLASAGVKVQVDGAPFDLDSDRESALAMALREAVTNVLRHAGADSCSIRFQQQAGTFTLEISDDGRGGEEVEGSGLSGMRERIEALDGTVERDSSRGTRLLIELPTRTSEKKLAVPGERSA